MEDLALYSIAVPIVFWFSYHCYTRALAFMRRDAKETAALRVAGLSPAFAEALQTVRGLKCGIAYTAPHHPGRVGGPE
jgi:hypothetical protein